jgi:pRiA4b ORF-3-like protein
MGQDSIPEIYQIRVWIRGISPSIWRRLWIRSDSTLADLHYTLQIAFSWTDFHLHRFRIHGKDFGITRAGGPWYSADARDVRLAEFRFQINDRFLYEYDFGYSWQHEIRVERRLAVDSQRSYPVCVGGRRASPPEDCGGALAYMQRVEAHRLDHPWEEIGTITEALSRLLEAKDDKAIGDVLGDLQPLREAADRLEAHNRFQVDHFDRQAVNRRLKMYAAGNESWMLESAGEGT